MAGVPFAHLPVLPEEVLYWLKPQSGGVYLDGTLGGAGHARLILDNAPGSRLLGIDRDPAAISHAAEILAPYSDRVSLHQGDFDQAAELLARLDIEGLDGMLLDLGVSSHQLDSPERGFSFRHEASLDMRMNPEEGIAAAEVVNQMEEAQLRQLFFDYGEERYSRRIAARIVAQREQCPIVTTTQLANLVCDSVPGGNRPDRIHPATRVFQALRIYVNDELEQVRRGVNAGIDLLKPEGRLVVISFHSLEDRIVKHLFRDRARGCICPPRLPVCQCDHHPDVTLLTRKGIRAKAEEIEYNHRSRSAILRAVQRC
ncbi:MAG: 16S rRNA (cytosine(1402)-N(4))-methyltransferase RsmH [Pelovirga sp.]